MSTAAGVHITFVLDRSGSMQSIREDVVGGFNAFLAEQQAQPDPCRMTFVQFDTQGFDYIQLATPIEDVEPMKLEDFIPRSGTPLYDAVGRAIKDAVARVKTQKDPEVQLFVIFTDGEENSSHDFDREKIFVLIEEKQSEGWTFAFLGANQDAYAEGAKMGVAAGSTQSYAGDAQGTAKAMASVSSSTSNLRSNTSSGVAPDPDNFYGGSKPAEDDLKSRTT